MERQDAKPAVDVTQLHSATNSNHIQHPIIMPERRSVASPAPGPEVSMREFLRQLIARDFEVDPQRLNGDARLHDFAIDSLGLIEIMFAVEDRFGIVVPPDLPDVRAPIDTLDDLVRYLEHLVAEQHAAPGESPGT
jgi:acyl carrier protein